MFRHGEHVEQRQMRVTCSTVRAQPPGTKANVRVRQLALPWWKTDSFVLRPKREITPTDLMSISRPGGRTQSRLRFTAREAKPRVDMAREVESGEKAGTRADVARSLNRAIDILEVVAEGPIKLPELARRTALSTATCYRLAAVLADRGLLATSGRSGYRLGNGFGRLRRTYEHQTDERLEGPSSDDVDEGA